MTAVGRHALVGSNPTPGAITSTTTNQLLTYRDGRETNPDPESVQGQPVFSVFPSMISFDASANGTLTSRGSNCWPPFFLSALASWNVSRRGFCFRA